MEYRTLGNSDLKVSRICMGCMGFGDPTQGQHTTQISGCHGAEQKECNGKAIMAGNQINKEKYEATIIIRHADGRYAYSLCTKGE